MDEVRPQFYTAPKKITLNGLRPDTVKLLDRNTGENFHNTGAGNVFLDRTPKKKKKTTTNNKQHKKNTQNPIKRKAFSTAKEKTQQVKKAMGENICKPRAW